MELQSHDGFSVGEDGLARHRVCGGHEQDGEVEGGTGGEGRGCRREWGMGEKRERAGC